MKPTALPAPSPTLEQMPGLRDIWLTKNQLSGHLPPSLGTLYLSENNFSGSISATLPATLKALQLSSDNSFRGEIAKSLADFKYLSDINLSQNQLSGSASMLLLGTSVLGTDIYLYQNRLRFNFSKVVEFPRGLTALDLSHNLIYGTIPQQIGYAASMLVLDLSYNRLQGQIPPSLGSFPVSAFPHNDCLCGATLAAPCRCCQCSLPNIIHLKTAAAAAAASIYVK